MVYKHDNYNPLDANSEYFKHIKKVFLQIIYM